MRDAYSDSVSQPMFPIILMITSLITTLVTTTKIEHIYPSQNPSEWDLKKL